MSFLNELKQFFQNPLILGIATIIGCIITALCLLFYFYDKKGVRDNKITRKEEAELNTIRHKELVNIISEVKEEIKNNNSCNVSNELKNNINNITKIIAMPITADDFFIKAFSAFIDKNYDKAIEHYQKVIELSHDYVEAYNELGVIYLEDTHDYEKAREYFQKAIELRPDFAIAYYNMGYSYNLEQNYRDSADALKYYLRAIEIKPDFPNPYQKVGVIYHLRGDYKKALDYYHKHIGIEPNAVTYMNIGVVHIEFDKKYHKAIEYFNKAIELRPDYIDAHFNMGLLYLQNIKDYDKAIECFEKILEIDPNNVEAKHNLNLARLVKSPMKINNMEDLKKLMADTGTTTLLKFERDTGVTRVL